MSKEAIIFDISPIVFAHTATQGDGGATSTLRYFIRLISAGWWDYVGFAEDAPRDTLWRVKQYTPYKAKRKPKPPVLISQLSMCKAVLAAGGVPAISAVGHEADDIIATMVSWCYSHDTSSLVVSPDSDMLALVTAREHDRRWVPCPACNKPHPSGERRFCKPCHGVGFVHSRVQGDKAANCAVYNPRTKKLFWRIRVWEKLGVWPREVPVYKGICGDRSDGIPGVPHYGKVKTKALLRKCRQQIGVCLPHPILDKELTKDLSHSEMGMYKESLHLAQLHCPAVQLDGKNALYPAQRVIQRLTDWSRRIEDDKGT